MKITLNKPYSFEGKEYNEIDLSEIENFTARNLVNVERRFEKSGAVSTLKEMNLEYCMIVASEVSGLPIEFFMNLPAKVCTQIKIQIAGFFLGAE